MSVHPLGASRGRGTTMSSARRFPTRTSVTDPQAGPGTAHPGLALSPKVSMPPRRAEAVEGLSGRGARPKGDE
jgi:hypothetical protein